MNLLKLLLILVGFLSTSSFAQSNKDLVGWWMPIDAQDVYNLSNSATPKAACGLIVKGQYHRSTYGSVNIKESGELLRCSADSPIQCEPDPLSPVNFSDGFVSNPKDLSCSGHFHLSDSNHFTFSGGCGRESNLVDTFRITEEGFKKYAEVVNQCSQEALNK